MKSVKGTSTFMCAEEQSCKTKQDNCFNKGFKNFVESIGPQPQVLPSEEVHKQAKIKERKSSADLV